MSRRGALARRRRGRGLVVLVEQYRSPHSARAHDAERFTRLNGNAARWRAAACHAIRHADAAAGRLLRGPGNQALPRTGHDRRAHAASVRLQLAGARRPRHIRGAGSGQPAAGSQRRHAQTPAGEDRGSHHRAPRGRADRAPVADERGTRKAAGCRSPADDAQPADGPPLPPSSLIAMPLQPEPQQSPAAMPAPAVALIVRHPEGSIRVSYTNRRAAGRAAA